jgi:hypothetical protein
VRGEAGAVRYVRAVERALAALASRPFVLSPRDYALISAWHARGVPLGLVLETIDEKVGRHGGPSRARGLSRLAPAIEEAWEAVRDGRFVTGAAAPADELPPLASAVEAWRRARSAAPDGSPLRLLLDGLLARHEARESPVDLDAGLDRSLPDSAPASLVARVAQESRGELEPFRKRMDPAVYEATVRRSLTDRLRRALGLPRLALTSTLPSGDR